MKIKVDAAGSVAHLALKGDIDDGAQAAMGDVEGAIGKRHIVVDCDGIGRINSIGVKGWIAGLESWRRNRQVSFKNCHHNFIDMAIMVPAFAEGCEILSLQATFTCEDCRRERLLLVEVKDDAPVRPKDLVCTRSEEHTSELQSH